MAVTSWPREVVVATRAALEPLADPARAEPMAAYMRGQFTFLGVATSARRAATRAAWSALPGPAPGALAESLDEAARQLWRLPAREYQYAGCDLLARYLAPAVRRLPATLLTGLVQDLVTTRSWWDTVDALRPAAVGPLVLAHRELVAVMQAWCDGTQPWLVRSALIHQLGYAERTDEALLMQLCARRAADQELFVAKAVGWALRTHARRRPGAVLDFVTAHPELSALARREAVKHLEV